MVVFFCIRSRGKPRGLDGEVDDWAEWCLLYAFISLRYIIRCVDWVLTFQLWVHNIYQLRWTQFTCLKGLFCLMKCAHKNGSSCAVFGIIFIYLLLFCFFFICYEVGIMYSFLCSCFRIQVADNFTVPCSS